jgi:hypothetical protein
VGRPRLRWEECVCQDWRSVASNREEWWWAILRKAGVHTGLSCQYWWRWMSTLWYFELGKGHLILLCCMVLYVERY